MTIDYTQPPQQFTPPPPPGAPQQKSSGCWKWGALGCVLVVFIGCAFAAGIVFFVFSIMKSSDVYRGALQRVQQSPEVQAQLGTPIEAGWFLSGKINVENDTGVARIRFPVHGPKGKATVHVDATKRRGKWIYSELTVDPEHAPSIDLLRGENP